MPKAEIAAAFRVRRLDMARLAALKPEWRVSMQALLYRAQSLGLIEQERAAWLWRKFAMNRIKLREPPSLDFAPEIPGVVACPASLRILENVQSMARAEPEGCSDGHGGAKRYCASHAAVSHWRCSDGSRSEPHCDRCC
jgi:Zn-dependent peptidase ImmA (M78 family)